MENRKLFSVFLIVAGLAFASGIPTPEAQQRSFPPSPGVEYEQSVITIPIYLPGKRDPAEILKLDAYMKLVREAPVRNGIGHRQFEFTIAEWELIGYSKVLDGYITFTLTAPVQPKSLGVALQKDSDYPAIIVYNAIYDIWLDQKRIAASRPGVGFAKNVHEIPPRNITVAFEKPFETKEFNFSSGTCEDMQEIDRPTFERGVAKGKAIRAGKIPPPR